jgi:TfoX/Sxy family transcriptional regulator of competence genes
MAYNEHLANKTREILSVKRNVKEKTMMGGLTFMVNDKMCVGILNDDLMLRIDPLVYEKALERKGCSEMDFTGRPMKGFVFVGPEVTKLKKDLEHWISTRKQRAQRRKSNVR